LSDTVKKNLLDLEYSRYLQYNTTVIVTLFTYVVGITLVIATEQIRLTVSTQFVRVAALSIVVAAIALLLFFIFHQRLKEISEQIRDLEL